MNKPLQGILGAVVVLATSACGQQGAPVPTPQAFTHEIAIHQVEPADFANVLWAPGEVVAACRFAMVSKVSGHIRAVLVDEGDRVVKGQLLVEVDATQVEAGIAQAKADIASAEASLSDAKADVVRFERLARTQALAEDQLRDARVRAVAEQAVLDRAEAELRSRLAEREHVRMVAPEDAIVVERLLEPGDLAGAGLPILRLESSDARELEVFVPAARAHLVETGGTLPARLDKGTEVTARVLGVVSSADPSTRQLKVRLSLPEEIGAVPGTYGQARLVLGRDASPALPADAVTSRAGIEGVFVVDGEARARFRSLRLGRRWGGIRQVLAGLSPGDRVVLAPPPRLRDGDRVREK